MLNSYAEFIWCVSMMDSDADSYGYAYGYAYAACCLRATWLKATACSPTH